ncbi:ABC transporter substrate-binding protein [Cohnella boryungensis]|uniref:ABC transporter substrate-binding protein n=1 Tax=Cohnella boryungensis TaxID=768479 RepID=A0ABV8S8D9_9BACL
MKLKALSSALLALCLVLIVSACGQNNNKNEASPSASGSASPSAGESGANGKITLKMWYWNGAISDSTIEAAKAKFPNVDLQAEKLPSGGDFLTKLKTTISGGGSGPDIVTMDAWISTMLTYKDKFLNLYDQGARDIKPEYLEWKWKMGATLDDQYLIGLPIDVAPVVLYYRADLFKEAGVASTPEEIRNQVKTTEDYLALMKQVKEKTGTQSGTLVDLFRSIMGQSSQNYFDVDGNYIGNKEHVKKAWDAAVTAYKEGVTFPFSSDSEKNAAMNNGKISSFTGASWAVGDVISAAPNTKGKWNIAYPPGGVGNQGGSFMGILNSTKYPKEAYEVVKFLVSPDNLIEGYKEFGNYPSTPGIYDSPEMVNQSEFFGGQDLSTVFGEAAKDVQIALTDSRDEMVINTLVAALGSVDAQKKDPEKAWTEAQEQILRQLSR